MLSTTVAVLLILVGIEAVLLAVGMVSDILIEVLAPSKFTGAADLVGHFVRELFFWVAIPLVIVGLMAVFFSITFLVPILV